MISFCLWLMSIYNHDVFLLLENYPMNYQKMDNDEL
jgi:hypothetical protein